VEQFAFHATLAQTAWMMLLKNMYFAGWPTIERIKTSFFRQVSDSTSRRWAAEEVKVGA
jgi:hypothetical protein